MPIFIPNVMARIWSQSTLRPLKHPWCLSLPFHMPLHKHNYHIKAHQLPMISGKIWEYHGKDQGVSREDGTKWSQKRCKAPSDTTRRSNSYPEWQEDPFPRASTNSSLEPRPVLALESRPVLVIKQKLVPEDSDDLPLVVIRESTTQVDQALPLTLSTHVPAIEPCSPPVSQ